MSLTNPNKPVTEARLQEFYHRIKSYLGFTKMPSEDMDEVISPLPSIQPRYHKYSTEEHIVGEWIDGKPIYERTYVNLDIFIANEAFTNTSLDASVVDQVISCIGFDNNGSVLDGLLCNTYGQGQRHTTFNIQCSRNTGGATVHKLVIQYTKTTE